MPTAPTPAAPSDLRLVSLEKDKDKYFATLEWMDNATDDFSTGFEAVDFPWGAGVYSGQPDGYPEGTGLRTTRVRVAVGEYDIFAYCAGYIPGWPPSYSENSNTVHINTKDADKGQGGKPDKPPKGGA